MRQTAHPSMNKKQRLLSFGLVVACILLALLLAAFMAVSAVILESHTYKRAARQEAYLDGVTSAAIDIMKETAQEEGLSQTMLMKHVQRDDMEKLARQNASDAALVLKGSQVIYGDSFDRAALETDLYQFYEQQLSEPAREPAEGQTEEQTTQNAPDAETDAAGEPSVDSTSGQQTGNAGGFFHKTEEDPEREALREQCDALASKIGARIDTVIRVINMEQVVYEASGRMLLDWLRFMGRGGILLPLILLALGLLLLYRQVWERGFSPWLAVVGICSGAALLVCAALIPAGGWLNPDVEPVQLAILYKSMMRGLLTELTLMALLWFIIGYLAVRSALGRPVSTKKLRALLNRLKKTPDAEDSPEDETALSDHEENACEGDPNVENATAPSISPINDSESDKTPAFVNNTSNDKHGDLFQTIKKAAADSTNALLGRKR